MNLPPRTRRKPIDGGVRLVEDTSLPPQLRDPAVLAYIGALLAQRPGADPPPMPAGVTKASLPGLVALLDDPPVRLAVVRWLSKLL